MQIVIDINDNEYLSIKNYPDNVTSYPVTIHLYEALRNGTPLPKGHGRLIDADRLEPRDISPESWYSPMWGFELVDIEDAPTIIEADKDDSNDNK